MIFVNHIIVSSYTFKFTFPIFTNLEMIALFADAICTVILNFVLMMYRNRSREMNQDFHQFHSSPSNRSYEINFSETRRVMTRFASSIKRNRVNAVNSFKKICTRVYSIMRCSSLEIPIDFLSSRILDLVDYSRFLSYP